MYSCEFCEISKNTFSTEHLRTTASEKLQSLRCSTQVLICEIFKNTFFYRTSLVAGSDCFRIPVCNFIKKRLRQRCFPVNYAKCLRTSFDRTPPDDWFLCLSVNFEKNFGTCLL